MRPNDLEHPDITRALRTGYPHPERKPKIRCEECGAELDGEKVYEDEDHEYLCEDCLLYLHGKKVLL